MLAQADKKGKNEPSGRVEQKLPDVKGQLDTLRHWVEQSARDGTAAHEVERGIFAKLLGLGKTSGIRREAVRVSREHR